MLEGSWVLSPIIELCDRICPARAIEMVKVEWRDRRDKRTVEFLCFLIVAHLIMP